MEADTIFVKVYYIASNLFNIAEGEDFESTVSSHTELTLIIFFYPQ